MDGEQEDHTFQMVNMANNCEICRMQEPDIAGAAAIWVRQYELYCGGSDLFPRHWIENTGEITRYLAKKVVGGAAIAIKSGKKLLGYLTYDEFPFHGEKSVFCPVIAHAAIDEYKEEAYLSLYKYISGEWVDRDVLNHMWTIFYHDTKLKGILYDLGFGSYLVDAYTHTNKTLAANSAFEVREAKLQDADLLYDLVEESRAYYKSAPIFLNREQCSREDIENVINRNKVFIAWEARNAVGFIHVGISQTYNIIDLSTKSCGLIDEIGAYIKPGYRGKGLGKDLLKNVFDHCRDNGVDGIHVDFETANLFANKFWKKHFNPMLLSARRTINKNMNQ
jgi:GNAT superfamily N-acetyltransferase